MDMANQQIIEGDLKNCIFGGKVMDWFLCDNPKTKALKTDRMALGKLWEENAILRDIKARLTSLISLISLIYFFPLILSIFSMMMLLILQLILKTQKCHPGGVG